VVRAICYLLPRARGSRVSGLEVTTPFIDFHITSRHLVHYRPKISTVSRSQPVNSPIFNVVVFAFLLALPVVLASRRFGTGRAVGALGVALVTTGLAGLASPLVNTVYLKLALWAAFMDVLMGKPLASAALIVLYSTALPFGNIEWLVRFATDRGWIEYHKPMTTRIMYGIEDWREHVVTNDDLRIQDPVLLWRPRPGMPPYNEQGFKTDIIMEVPKPPNVYRIMAYGDSNTDGPVGMDWSNELQKLLTPRNTPELKYEVINAGVAGYSSYQGLQRFMQDVDKYQPDLIFVSFGWNDLSQALDKPDKLYKQKSEAMVFILRVLIHYRTYQAIQHYVQAPRLKELAKTEIPPRVSLQDYMDNMRSFAELGHKKGVAVVFLSRPYKYSTEEILNNSTWRSKVPSYNRALEEFTEEQGEYFIDVQRHYEYETEGLFSDESHFYTDEGMAEMGRFLLRELDSRGLLGKHSQ